MSAHDEEADFSMVKIGRGSRPNWRCSSSSMSWSDSPPRADGFRSLRAGRRPGRVAGAMLRLERRIRQEGTACRMAREASRSAVGLAVLLVGCVAPAPPPGEPVPAIALAADQSEPVAGTLSITATPSNFSPAAIEFRLDTLETAPLVVDTTPPFTVTIDTTAVSRGKHVVWATGRDDRYTVWQPTSFTTRPNFVVVVVDDMDALTMPLWEALPKTKQAIGDRGTTFGRVRARPDLLPRAGRCSPATTRTTTEHSQVGTRASCPLVRRTTRSRRAFKTLVTALRSPASISTGTRTTRVWCLPGGTSGSVSPATWTSVTTIRRTTMARSSRSGAATPTIKPTFSQHGPYRS